MAAKNPVLYAEEDLGVHEVFNDVQEALAAFEESQDRLSDLRSEKRNVESSLADEEGRVAIEVTAMHGDASQAARDRLIKSATLQDAAVRKCRETIGALTGQIDDEEGRKQLHRMRVDVLTARMNELGGYLNYLAQAKAAQIAAKPVTVSGILGGSPW